MRWTRPSQYIKRKYNLLIGERTAEQVKSKSARRIPWMSRKPIEIKGRDLMEECAEECHGFR
jgi:rod shape-determining protein MreB